MNTAIDSRWGRWKEALRAFNHPRVITMLFLGFSAGIPLLLIFSSLSLWLGEAGVARSTVTFFSWAALGYSFKFVWAPLVDQIPLPVLTRLLGRRRSWLLFAQLLVITAIALMAMTDPAAGQRALVTLAVAAVFLGFSSATQDIVIDAYRIESADSNLQALMSSTYIAGYRIGMIVAGAGALALAEYFGSTKGAYLFDAWRWTYLIMAGVMLVGVVTTLVIPEPNARAQKDHHHSGFEHLRFLAVFGVGAGAFVASFFLPAQLAATLKIALLNLFDSEVFAGFLVETARFGFAVVSFVAVVYTLIVIDPVSQRLIRTAYLAPVKDFFQRYGKKLAYLLLALICLYRISDIVLGVISNVFYQDLGFTKIEIASVVKTYGLIMSIVGGFLGGLLSLRYGVTRILYLGAALTVATNLLFVLLAHAGNDVFVLYFVISADNLTAGIASAAFIAFLSSLTNISFTAVQYAIFSSLMTLFPKLLAGYSGTFVDALGYDGFFLFASAIGLPVLVLIWWVNRMMKE